MPYTPKIYTYTCKICGAEYTSISSYDSGMCHNCRETARLQIVLLNPKTDEEKALEPLDETALVDTLINYFVEDLGVDIDVLLDNCIDTLSEISRNTYYVTPKEN